MVCTAEVLHEFKFTCNATTMHHLNKQSSFDIKFLIKLFNSPKFFHEVDLCISSLSELPLDNDLQRCSHDKFVEYPLECVDS